jgi:hypothetical protein
MLDVFSALHQSDISFSKGRDYSEEIKGSQIGGESPRKVQVGGAAQRGKLPFSIDVKGGEIVTLM